MTPTIEIPEWFTAPRRGGRDGKARWRHPKNIRRTKDGLTIREDVAIRIMRLKNKYGDRPIPINKSEWAVRYNVSFPVIHRIFAELKTIPGLTFCAKKLFSSKVPPAVDYSELSIKEAHAMAMAHGYTGCEATFMKWMNRSRDWERYWPPAGHPGNRKHRFRRRG